MLWLTYLALVTTALASYAPKEVDCPSGDTLMLRKADSLNDHEKDWIAERQKKTDKNLIDFLKLANMSDFDPEDFIKNKAKKLLTVGVAFSGGGYRAMLCGAGQLAALDLRTDKANSDGLGGLLQLSTYITGLSGGNWLVGSLVLNNWTSVQDVVDGTLKIWDLAHSIFNIGGWNVAETTKYYYDIYQDIDDKKDEGFDTSLTDIWGRALSHQFFDDKNYGDSLTWSGVTESKPFKDHDLPFPIVVANGREPGTWVILANSTVFEFSPYEMGSWDPSLYLFAQTKYVGTNMTDGKPHDKCIVNYDNGGFVMGTLSSLFNQFILQINTTSLPSAVKSIAEKLLGHLSVKDNDIAVYEPNPFYGWDDGEVHSITKNDTLYLCDGGEDLQNIPLYPLVQPQRKVDVIFAYDNSADTGSSWPNGTAMIATYQRQFEKQGNGTAFPYVPDAKTFRNLNLTLRPAFFGCDARNLSSLLKDSEHPDYNETDIPLVVYTANRPYLYALNQSTFNMKYEDNERDGMIRNGFEVASRNNMTEDAEWRACVGCAIIRREQERQGIEQSEQCKKCFARYCWDGKYDDDTPEEEFYTANTSGSGSHGGKKNSASSLAMSLPLYAAIAAMLLLV